MRMRLKTWYVAALGLASLVVLIGVSALTASRKAQDIYAELDELNGHHRRVEDHLRQLRADVNLSGIFVRDYLLDVVRERAPDYRQRIGEFRRTTMATLGELKLLIDSDEHVDSLQAKLGEYWGAFDPLFDWTTTEKIVRSASFLRAEVVPRREEVLAIAHEIEQINDANVVTQRQEVARRQEAFQADLRRVMWQTVLLGMAVSVVVVMRLRILERRSDEAEGQMRELSQRLRHTQEEERKNLSRELHDHVAQVLTGLRMELGRIERLNPELAPVVAECKKLVDDLFRTVRSLALGLRPSMLDDFGLQAALEWHVRDFMTRYSLTVDLQTEGDLDGLPDKHRTCVFRIVQEAMTNCARHAEAKRITVSVTVVGGQLALSIADDGHGIRRSTRRTGLGLRGIEERVKELHGDVTLLPGTKGGTTLAVHLPLSDGRVRLVESSHASG